VDFRKIALGQSDRFHLNAASGWLGLGDFGSAVEELRQISAPMQEHPEVLLARCEIHFTSEQWEPLLPIADKLIRQFPKLDIVWINRSYALHELKRTQEAFDALLPAAEKFPKRWIVRYNLACYCSQLGRAEEAMRWLEQTMTLAGKKKIKAMALDDPDFEPLREQIKAV
jgi:tetratricopeptide (TPR) repeat protein